MEKSDAKMNKVRVRLISMVIPALCKVQTVSFHKLALAFDNASTADSSLRRLQRFMPALTCAVSIFPSDVQDVG